MSYTLNSIVDQVITQLKNIDGTPSYNHNLNHNYIVKKFYAVDQAPGYTFICISSIRMVSSLQTDQITYEVPIELEFFGYVTDEADPLGEVLKLTEDIDKVIYANEKLGTCDVWDLSLVYDAASVGDFGIVLCTLRCKTNYYKT